MASSDFTEEQRWLLGQIDAPARANRIKDILQQRLRSLDWAFSIQASEGGTCVSLGSLTLITAFCEADPPNPDSVCNNVAVRAGPGDFQSETFEVVDKSNTGRVALEQLERALSMLRRYREEFAALDVPMGWAYDD